MANNIVNRPFMGPIHKNYSNQQYSSRSNQNNQNNSNSTNLNEQQQQITGAPLDAPADCTIGCDKGHITAHKLILCDHSQYFKDILSKYPTAEHPIIILTELNIVDIKIIVNYMYTGELVITNDSSPSSLLRAAQILKIDSLTADEDEDDLDEDQQQQNNQQQEDQDQELDTSSGRHNSSNDHVTNSNIYYQQHDDFDDEDDEDDLMMDDDEDLMDDDDLDNIAGNHSISSSNNNNSRLINSIKNIYSLNQFIDTTSPPPQQHSTTQPLSLPGSNNTTTTSSSSSSAGSQQQFVKLDFGSNNHLAFSNNNTPNSLSHHLQQQLSSHLDLQDLQDSKLDNKNNKIRCHLCNIGLSDVKCLYRHVLTRHLPEKWGYKCEFCDREFSRDDHLMRHYTTKHKNMEFNREKIRETRRLNREMAKNFHDQVSTV